MVVNYLPMSSVNFALPDFKTRGRGTLRITKSPGHPSHRPRKRRPATVLFALDYGIRTNKMSLDWSQCPAVESVPGKVSGAWVLRGTRMPVSVIFENLEAGANIDDIMEWFEGLDREQIKAVIEFAARSLDAAPSASRR